MIIRVILMCEALESFNLRCARFAGCPSPAFFGNNGPVQYL